MDGQFEAALEPATGNGNPSGETAIPQSAQGADSSLCTREPLENEGTGLYTREALENGGAGTAQVEAVGNDNPVGEAAERDFRREAAELLEKYPEARGAALPDGVLKAALEQGLSLAQAYGQHKEESLRQELESLRKENAALKQAAKAYEQAPVRGVSMGGATDNGAADPFLRGFESF